MSEDHHQIRLRGVCQNNLKNLDLDLPLNALVVVTGVSGSGKSSLAFDTVYAEGQRRYVETFSPYARQFLERMDRPRAERIDGIPPAIAIDQTNPVRTSRSTVGTMTELNDHLKLLFARAARLYCRGCGREVRRDEPEAVLEQLGGEFPEGCRVMVCFGVRVPANFTHEEVQGFLAAQGYTRIHRREPERLEVVQDRTRLTAANRSRLVEALEQAMKQGQGQVSVYPLGENLEPGEARRFSAELHCAQCDIHYRTPIPNSFSFNSPAGACDTCRGFGRVIGVDWSRVVPDESLSLLEGAVKPLQSDSYSEVQEDLMGFAYRRGIPTDRPWRELTQEQRMWVIEGEGPWERGVWYGVRRFFDWLETKAYKMHIRVLLSKYRSYDTCPVCRGARLKDESLLWRLGRREDADGVLEPGGRVRPAALNLSGAVLGALPGLNLHDLMGLPLDRLRAFFQGLHLPAPLDGATDLLLTEIGSRLRYLIEVGVGYLTLDRQSRTLSGGEVQRINLTTALGTSLVNTLFVLDEPSIGLHPRDMQRVIGVLQRLRDAGNSLLVVEHDPEVMLAADQVLDLGPGPGEAGGSIVFQGTPADLLTDPRSRTGAYLAGRERVGGGRLPRAPAVAEGEIRVLGARAHNLKDIDVGIPLNRLVCLTGVSGSGKSTLVRDVLYNALARILGHPEETPGEHRAIEGYRSIEEVVLVDQSPIGRTSRANPGSYVGALDGIRKLFAKEPLAKERGYTAGTFSFNAGDGRCATCGGSGFEHLEMQFLADVYLPCADCNGQRFRRPVLEVRHQGRSIAEMLGLTVNEAAAAFAEHPDIRRALEPLRAVGLGYLKLGQPVPTLSGGEAQRLKLAGHLAERGGRRRGHTLFLFDEPTTGLHFADIAVLLNAFDRLLRAGHSLVVIEHNLDLIEAADWIVDLGPEGGDGGGQVVCQGTPEAVCAHPTSHTAQALRAYGQARSRPAGTQVVRDAPRPVRRMAESDTIEILHAREHNLKNISLRIPREKLTVITGVSGSGKSTLAFDILFNEGQRRYLESLNAYARQFVQPAARPDVDAIFGIPPTVAIEQRTSRGGHKSTVGTLTEIHHFLRLLFVKLGVQHCPDCAIPIQPQSREAIAERLLAEWQGRRMALFAPLIVARKGLYTDLAKWAARKGFTLLRVDGEPLPTDRWPVLDRYREHHIDLPVGELAVRPGAGEALRALVNQALDQGRGTLRAMGVDASGNWVGPETSFSTQRACPGCGRSFDEPDPRLFSYHSKHGWCPTCYGTGLELQGFDGEQSGEEREWLEAPAGETRACPACNGARLRPEALAVSFQDWSISDYSACSVTDALQVFEDLTLGERELAVARDLVGEVIVRLRFLCEVGLGYLGLDRGAPTLSGGEAQRIRLAAQLGSNLRGVCYVLDEPTIGLHPRDNRMLLDTLAKLEAKGNTLVVVEHDEETIRRAEHVVDLGPGAGVRGGEVVAEGRLEDLLRNPASVTGRSLAQPLAHPLLGQRRAPDWGQALRVRGANLNNLKEIEVHIPLGRLVCVTGVSGSGKSTLVREVLQASLKSLLTAKAGRGGSRAPAPVHGCRALTGWEAVSRVLEVDQTPIGKTPRSCPSTYVGFWDDIRRLFAAVPEARLRGYTPGRFSFNTTGGRCDGCEGQGFRRIEMSFLPNVEVPCEVCGGARFNPETRLIEFKGRSISDVLAMTVDEAIGFFAAHPPVHRALGLLQDVGLGYLSLGQRSPTLSGGEAQRIKLVAELAKVRPGAAEGRRGAPGQTTLYLLDEPTIGLHRADVERLLRVLHRLVDAGHTVLVIEHNLDVIAEADWVIDLGPEGGEDGGRIVIEGTPETLVAAGDRSHTGAALRGLMLGH